MNNMRVWKIFGAITALSLAGFASTQAAQITGFLNIAGTATFNHKLGAATTVTAFSGVTVGGGNTGAFSGIPLGTPVTMASTYIFNPSTPTPGLWSVGGFTFDLQTSAIVVQNNNFLSITGTGTISGNGFDATPAVWAFSTQNAGKGGKTFTFSANTAAGVPDGGMTVTLLGVSLIGLSAARAKFGKR